MCMYQCEGVEEIEEIILVKVCYDSIIIIL